MRIPRASQNGSTAQPPISALICTADRSDDIVVAVQSVLRSRGNFTELLVVDQSQNDESEQALKPLLSNPRLRYVRTSTRGKGVALAIGLEAARGDIVAVTDDDCEVGESWPNEIVAPLLRDPLVAVTYGQVLPADHDHARGFIPTYVLDHDRECRTIWDKLRARGIGANTALRKSVVQAIGGFDPELGPGGRFYSCIDGDMSVRLLLEGHRIYETKASSVVHHGFRTWAEGKSMAYRSFYGIAASYMKPLRRGRLEALPVFMFEFLWHALLPFVGAALTFQRPLGFQRIRGFCAGAALGLFTPMDGEHLVYSHTPDPEKPRTSYTVPKGSAPAEKK